MITSAELIAPPEPHAEHLHGGFPEPSSLEHRRLAPVGVFPSPTGEYALEILQVPSGPTSFSAIERARPDLHGCIVLDSALRVVYVSRPLSRVLELRDEDWGQNDVLELLSPLIENQPEGQIGSQIGSQRNGWRNHAATPLRVWLEAAVAGPLAEETPALRLDFDPDRSLEASLHRIDASHWVLGLEELSAPREGHRDMFAVLYHDRLTGAANRALFEHKLDHALQRMNNGSDESVTVLFLDLDRFKSVNDTLGHGVGDSLLGLVSERLRSGLREADTLARLGGDEFAILLRDGIDEQRITELASRLIDLVRRPYLVNGHVVNVGASIGAARAPEDGRTRDQLLRSADLALYHSKSAGRGVFHFFAPSMEERAQERRAMELDLRKALVMRQFELHYQPQIDVEKGTVIGLEALLRWRHPHRGTLLPSEFLPFAEEIGLAIPIGNWVLRTASKDAAVFPDSMTIAVNVSPAQFESTEFSVAVASALNGANLPGSRLEIEVTEAILLRDSDNVRSNLQALRKMGVRVAMDSFGTGLTSLSQLVNFPFDKIKIDRSLISTTVGDAKSRAILRAISALGQSLGIATLAAGVETPEHLAHVRAEGCHSVQGFYYSKAVPARELGAVLDGLVHTTDKHLPRRHHGTDTL